MDCAAVRQRSWDELTALNCPINPHLPLIDNDLRIRDVLEVANRCLALFCVVGVSYGFDRKLAHKWLDTERLLDYTSPYEKSFLQNEIDDTNYFRAQVETLFAFTIILGIAPNIAPTAPCPDDLINFFPDTKRNQDSATFRSKIKMIHRDSAIQHCDLLYCAHWIAVEFRKPIIFPGLSSYAMIERRRAYEWTLGETDWDDLTLDT